MHAGFDYFTSAKVPTAPSEDLKVDSKDIIKINDTGKVSEYIDGVRGTLTPTVDSNGLFNGYRLDIYLDKLYSGNPTGDAFWSQSNLAYNNGVSMTEGINTWESTTLGGFSVSPGVTSTISVPYASGYVKLYINLLGPDTGGGTINACIFACR